MQSSKITSLKPRAKAYLLLILVAAIWGIASPIIKFTLGGVDPLTFLTYRFGIATIFAIILFSFTGWHLPKNPKTLLSLVLYGFLTSTVSLGLLFLGLDKTTVLDSSLITLTNPLVISVAGVLFLKERITKREKIGMSIALLGSFLTVVGPILQNGSEIPRLTGNFLIFGYVIIAAIAAVMAKKLLRKGVNPATLANLSFVIGFISLIPFALFNNPGLLKTIFNISFINQAGVWYMAIVSGSLAYYLFNKAQKTIEISEASVFSYLYPLFSAPLAVLWLGESITPVFIIGGIIIAIGVTIAEVKKKRYTTE
ncbi:EamA family transporter [Candidatus Microgenomates bacterium]|nr:EamA family transporter [Candidatus Microgenomates bacterium]